MSAATSGSLCKPAQIPQPPAQGKKNLAKNLAPGSVSLHAKRQTVPEKGAKKETGGMCVCVRVRVRVRACINIYTYKYI